MGELADARVERRGEEHRLPGVRELPHDAVDLWLEAHVEHAVGLVENEGSYAFERDCLALEEIVQATGGRNDDVGASRALRLSMYRDSPVDRRDLDAARRECGDLDRDLRGELARGDEHERRGTRVAGLEPLDERDREADGLPGARRSLGEDVASGERVRENALLDRERVLDGTLGQAAHDARGYAELGKGLHSIQLLCCYVVEIRLPRPIGGTEEVKPHGTTASSVPAG